MPPPVEHSINNLTAFTECVEAALGASRVVYGSDPSVVNWYRGCGSSTYPLLPSLYRHPTKTAANDLLKLEREMLAWFKRESILHETVREYLDPDFEQLFFMQHYGVPTRLLDWTANPFIGLYFALTSAHRDKATGKYGEDAALWILSPNAWNEKSLSELSWGGKGALALEHPEKKGYAPRKSSEVQDLIAMYGPPVAMHGVANTTRMFAQKGVFTIFGRNTDPMEKAFSDDNYPAQSLTKLLVPKDEIGPLLDSILAIGYTDSVSYPDLHGLAMEIKRSFGF